MEQNQRPNNEILLSFGAMFSTPVPPLPSISTTFCMMHCTAEAYRNFSVVYQYISGVIRFNNNQFRFLCAIKRISSPGVTTKQAQLLNIQNLHFEPIQ